MNPFLFLNQHWSVGHTYSSTMEALRCSLVYDIQSCFIYPTFKYQKNIGHSENKDILIFGMVHCVYWLQVAEKDGFRNMETVLFPHILIFCMMPLSNLQLTRLFCVPKTLHFFTICYLFNYSITKKTLVAGGFCVFSSTRQLGV
jgi:hypothetical protein